MTAVAFAGITIEELGFVVVWYKRRRQPKPEERTSILWNSYHMPQPFTVVRRATPAEAEAQLKLYRAHLPREVVPRLKDSIPWILVTD